MTKTILKILTQKSFSRRSDVISLLSVDNDAERNLIFQKAAEVREKHIGNNIYLRGLIEYSNICSKNCLYCGIRAGNKKVTVAKAEVFYTKDGGASWSRIALIKGSNPGLFSWRIPIVRQTKTRCRIKVVLKDAAGYRLATDISPGYFTINPLP